MTNDEARFLLQAYRAGGLDASDPALSDALAQAQKDPALAAWFAREQAHAAAIAAKLRAIQPPASLRETILAGMRAGREKNTRRRRWRRTATLALAACLAVLLGVAAWWRFAPIPGDSLDEYAVNFVHRGFLLQERSADVERLRAWLADRGRPAPAELPAEFARLRALGCRMLAFKNREVSLICFERDGREYHVFIARRNDPSAPAQPVRRELRKRHGHVYTTWSDANHDYVLVSDAEIADVRRML